MNPPKFTHAILRDVSRSLDECALTHLGRQPIDTARAKTQHQAYSRALADVGLEVTLLPEEPSLPDAVFVEDAAIMLDEMTILCRPGHSGRQAEVAAIRPVLEEIRPMNAIEPPGTLDGGDVLVVDRTLYVGQSSRSNAEGLRQLRELVEAAGYRVVPVGVHGCLHLKTAVTAIGPGVVVINRDWIDPRPWSDWTLVAVPKSEPWAANVLPVNGTLFAAESAPETVRLLRDGGWTVRSLDISELQKAEAGLTCLSLLYRVNR